MDTVIILDFGSQYTQLIARKIRELNVYCEIHPFDKIPPLTEDVKGVVFSGSPYSCNAADAPVPNMVNIITWVELAITAGAVFLFGILITSISSYISVNKFLKMSAGELYKI